MRRLHYLILLVLITILLTGCSGKDETVTFSAEIEQVSENSILVETIDYDSFDKASVDLGKAEYDFEPSAGQIVEVTILPEIRESYPVQVTAVKLVLKGEAERKVSDYFPIRENTEYLYEGKGNEFAGFSLYTDYTSEGVVQQMVSNGGTMLARVYAIRDGKVTRVLSKGEVYYRENMLQLGDGGGEVILMEPLKKGTAWTLEDGSTRSITGVNTYIKTPIGNFSCIEVITEGKNGMTIDYYAKDVGLVKTIFQSEGMEVSSTLMSMVEDAARKQTVRFYYPDIEDGRIYYMEKELEYRTNDSTGRILEEAYKVGVSNTLGVVLPTNAAIKTLTLDEEDHRGRKTIRVRTHQNGERRDVFSDAGRDN